MKFEKVYTVKKELNKEEFFREVLIKLGTSNDTPIDVVEASFEEVTEHSIEIIQCFAHVKTDYSASIGYDREEIYYVQEKRTDSNGRAYYVDVAKTRTVTDWRPHSGHKSDNVTDVTFNDVNLIEEKYLKNDDGYKIYSLLHQAVETVEDESIILKGEAVVDEDGLSEAQRFCELKNERSISLPGDRQRDCSYHSSSEIQRIICYKLPFYEVKFTYNNQEYIGYGFACGELDVYVEEPKGDNNNYSSDIETHIVKTVTDEVKQYTKNMIIGWTVYGSLTLLTFILILVKFYWLWPLSIISLVLAILLHYKQNNEYYKRMVVLEKEHFSKKRTALESVLSKYGMDPLSEEAVKEIDKNNKLPYVSGSYKAGPKKYGIICSILTVILIIASFVCNFKEKDARLHSADQFEFEIVSKEEEFDGNKYVIYYTYQISSDEIGAESMYFTVHVYQGDTEIGYLTSSLRDMNLDAGSTESYDVTLSEYASRYYNNELMVTLYESELEDFTYVFEVNSITFSDGEYHNYN